MSVTAGQRLTAVIALAIALVTVAGLALQYRLIARDLDRRQRELVRADLAGFAALYDQRRVIAVRQAIDYRMLAEPEGAQLLALADRDGALLAGKPGGWTEALPRPAEGEIGPITAFRHEGRPYLGVARVLRGGFPLWLARSTAETEATLAALRRVIAGVLAGVILVALGTGHLASRWIMGRVGRINRLADRVAEGDLAARLPGERGRDEFGLLERHIHAMLDRIEALHRATTHLSDSIAHELRTPLTRIQARLARLDLADEDAEAVMAEIRATVRMFDSLLEIARAQASVGGRPGPECIDLSGLLGELYDLYAPLAEERGLSFTADIDPGVTVLGDRNLVALLVSNLFENALKFTPEGERVTATLRAGRDRHAMTVSDTGPGLPPGFEDRLFDRFTRAEGQAAPGHGLGLALVQAVALRHGAKLSLPEVERGFAIRIDWPSVAETS